MKNFFQYMYLLFRNRRKARSLFVEEFGVSPDDPCHEEELTNITHDAIAETPSIEEITIPTRLALAFVLRPQGKGRGRKRPKKETWPPRQRALMLCEASERWAELVLIEGINKKKAHHVAADEIWLKKERRYPYAPIAHRDRLFALMTYELGKEIFRKNNPKKFSNSRSRKSD